MSRTADKDWLLKDCEKEDKLDVSAGYLDFSTIKFKKSKTVKSGKQHSRKVIASISADHKKRNKKAS